MSEPYPGRGWWTCLALGALSGGLLLLSFPPYGPGLLSFVALTPLLEAVDRSRGPLRAWSAGLAAGLAFFLPGAHWIGYVSQLGWALLAIYLALYPAFFALLCRALIRLDRGGRLSALGAASAWVLLEYLRFTLLTGFAWFPLGHALRDFGLFIQAADVVGSHGLSAAAAVVNVLIWRAFKAWRESRKAGRRAVWGPAASAAAVIAAGCVYGAVRLHSLETRPALRVAIVQANIPQELKELFTGQYDPQGIFNRYLRLSQTLRGERLDLVVWPETVVLTPFRLNVSPHLLDGYPADASAFAQNALADLARSLQAHLLIGAITVLPPEHGYLSDDSKAARIPQEDWRRLFNSAVLIDREGVYADRFDKIHIVPFGEYIPLVETFPFLADLVPFTVRLSRGYRETVFKLPLEDRDLSFGTMICYDDMYADLSRRLRKQGADFLVSISNDAWFRTSGELDQHFAAARFRAIESRTGFVRSGNNGITGLIGPDGSVTHLLTSEVDGKQVSKDASGVLTGELRTSSATSLYVLWGDAPVIWGAVLCLSLLTAVRLRISTRGNAREDGT